MMATSSSIHSNAFNFLSFVENGVDPRTGQYTCSLALPKLSGNDLAGPELPLRLVYNPLNTRDTGFGKGWTLQLSQYDTGSHMVSLSSGENFKVTGQSSEHNQLLMREKKLDTFHLHERDNDRYQVVHKSGLVEELEVVGADALALPVKMLAASGHHLSLDYTVFNGGALLQRVTNADGSLLLTVTRQTNKVEVLLHPGRGEAQALFSLVLQGSDSRVARIELPTSNLAGWRFGYELHHDLLCISQVEGPLGGSEQIFHGQSHLFPGDETRRLPRVTRHLHDPGLGQPLVDTRYDYDSNNFLGRNAPGLVWADTGEDNLFKLRSDYTYWTLEQLWDQGSDSPLRTIKRTFNRFHLAIEEVTTQGDCVKSVFSEYHIEDDKVFEEQPAQCQLPSRVSNTWHRTSAPGKVREDVIQTAYDESGNETLRIEADGIAQISEYYPASASDGCPADPQGFVRNLKQKITRPADTGNGDPQTLRSQFRYALQRPLSGGSQPWLAQVEETLFQENDDVELQKIVTHYVDEPDDSLQHGRTAKTETFIGGKATFTDFSYSKPQGRRTAGNVLRTVEVLSTRFDDSAKTIIRESSLSNGEPLLDLDDNDVEVAYVYDPLGRVVEEIVAPGTDFEARRSYAYVLVAQPGNSASQTVTDVNQVQVRSHVDGLQRVIREERQAADNNLRDIYTARHDAFGQRVESSEIDWLDNEDLPLTSLYTYDDWGEQDSVTGPDGVTAHTLNDPVEREVQSWRAGEGRTVTRSNVFDKPDSVERLDLAGNAYSARTYFYDGLGRTHHEFDAMKQFHYYEYDAFDRMTLRVLPDGTRIERRYASHSRRELPVWIGVDGQVLGEQGFDGLGRRTHLEVGSYREEYLYEAGRLRPSERKTPAGESIAYEYTPQLTTEPVGLLAKDEQASYTYDPFDAQLRVAENSLGRREFDYDAARHMSAERWIEGSTTWTATWSHSRLGRQLQHKDVSGLQSHSAHDGAGRLERLSQGQVSVDYAYDSLSRPYQTTCSDLDANTELVTTLAFDDWGREVSRILALTGQPPRTLTQGYREDDRLVSRRLQADGQTLLQESFDYDERGRLTRHTCTGSQLPVDRFGNAIVEQRFDFDPLDNLREVYTRFADNREDTCKRTFSTDDPCQLVNLQHTHTDYPGNLDLEYDGNGNLRFDELGRELLYDSQSRLLAIKGSQGEVIASYRYDAHDQLCTEVHDGTPQNRRFYQDERLDCSVQDGTPTSYLHAEDRPLAQQQAGTADNTLLLLTGANNSVLGEGQQRSLRETRYSAWGERDNDAMQCLLGFNGEIRDRRTGWYLLGNGYRVYNPYLMCFHSPDSLSPFEAGGINRYMYCAGDPVNFRDPTGHFIKLPKWMTPVAAIAGIVLGVATLGAAVPGILAAKTLALGLSALGGLTKLSLVGAAASVATGAATLMTPDITTKRWFAITTAVTGALALATGVAGLFRYSSIYGKLGDQLKAFKKSPADDFLSRAASSAGAARPSIVTNTNLLEDLTQGGRPPLSMADAPLDPLAPFPIPRSLPRPRIQQWGHLKPPKQKSQFGPVDTDAPTSSPMSPDGGAASKIRNDFLY